MDRRQEIIDHYERVRRKQIEEGSYNPHLNGDVAPRVGHINNQTVLRPNDKPLVEGIQKYLSDPTLI